MSGSEVFGEREPTIAELTTPAAIEAALVVGRAFEIWWRDCADPHALSADILAASAFRAGFELARQLFLDTQRAGARSDDPSAGCGQSGGSDARAATLAPSYADASGAPPRPVTRRQQVRRVRKLIDAGVLRRTQDVR